jgi:uncharacterized protein (TIGR02246 family)
MNKQFLRILLAGAFLFSIQSRGYSQSDDIDTLKKLNQDWLNSILNRDTATLGRILADDFVMITPMGNKNSRKDNLETAALKTVRVTAITLDSVNVTMLTNDVGIVTAWTHFVFNDGNRESRGKNSYQDVYVKRNGNWVAVAAHVTLLNQ